MIKIFPSKLGGEPLERHALTVPTTFDAWMRANVPSFEPSRLVISADLNGRWFDPDTWGTVAIGPGDQVDIYPEAKGKVVNTVLNIATLGAWSLVMKLIMPRVATPSSGSTQTGDDLAESSVKGNKAKLNDVIREIAGTRKVYPDFLLPLRRYFTDETTQWTEMLLCVGVGEFVIRPSEIGVGDTPILSLGDGASFAVYGPGADLSTEPCAVWWHSASEVGATSTGTAGLELTTTVSLAPSPNATVYQLNDYRIDIPDGGGSFPAGWEPGLVARIEAPYTYTIRANGTARAQITGPLDQLAITPGMVIEVTGDAAGLYIVHDYAGGVLTLDYTNGQPVITLPNGQFSFTIGYPGLRYELTGVGEGYITVQRLTGSGQVDDDWPGFEPLVSGSVTIVLDSSSLEGNWAGPYAASPEGVTAKQFQVDVFFPNGLLKVNKNGSPESLTVTIEIQYRDSRTAGGWTSYQRSYTGSNQDQKGYTITIDSPVDIEGEFRMRRIGAASTSTSVSDKVQWYGLRANLPVKKSYEGVTTLAIRVKGGARLASQSEQLINVIARRVLPYRMAGTWQQPDQTRAIEAFAAYVAKSVGYSDAQLDLIEFDRLAAVWRARGDWYDDVFTAQTTVKDAINRALQAGFSEITLENGQIRPARDEPRTAIQHMYTPQNMSEELSRSVTMVTPDDYNGVDVKFVNARTWQTETVECRLPGDEGTIVETIELDGVTDRDRAWRIGMRRRRGQVYRRWTYNWSTELDGLNSRYLDYCAVSDDVPGYGQSALLLGYVEGNGKLLLESSEPLSWSDAPSHVVAIRRPDGTLSGPWPATRVDDYRLTIADTLDFVPDVSWQIEPPHLQFGPTTRWSYPVLVTSVEPDSVDGAKLQAMSYDARVYENDNDRAPA